MKSFFLLLSFLLGSLFLALALPASHSPRPLPSQIKAVIAAVNKAVETEYYDPQAAARWLQNEKQYENLILHVKTKQEAVDSIREALARLHNSHVFFYTKEEWKLRQNVLPFTFEKRAGRVFIRTSFASDLKFGDEITEVDGQSIAMLEPKSLAKLANVYGNPLYGPASSLATLTVVSDTGKRKVSARRINLDNEDPVFTAELPAHALLIRLFSLGGRGDLAGIAHFKDSWDKATNASALVIDLRDCRGGWPVAASYLLDSLLGNSWKPFNVLDRKGLEVPPSEGFGPNPHFNGPRFTGRVAALIGGGTQSACEVVAAALKEDKRAVLVGDRTAGALNGFTTAFPMPNGFALLALPYTRTISPEKVSYEGIGVTPDKTAENTIDDFRAGRDRVSEQGGHLIEHAAQ